MHNYAVRETYTTISGKDDFLGSSPIEGFVPGTHRSAATKTSNSTKSVPLRSANYDPADFTVTLIPRRKLTYTGLGSIVVTPGSPAKTSAARRDGSSPAQGLTDLDGNPINQEGGKPGKFHILVNSGYTPTGTTTGTTATV